MLIASFYLSHLIDLARELTDRFQTGSKAIGRSAVSAKQCLTDGLESDDVSLLSLQLILQSICCKIIRRHFYKFSKLEEEKLPLVGFKNMFETFYSFRICFIPGFLSAIKFIDVLKMERAFVS